MIISLREEMPEKDRKKLVSHSDLMAKLLFYRGIFDQETSKKFLNPDYDLESNDPFLLKNIDKAIERIFLAIKNNQKICIYSDYDADGIPGAVVLSDYFKKINYKNVFNYIPHRNKEGFGMNLGAIKKISEEGANLIISIDCGITDFEPVDLANELEMDVIITDHHEPHSKTPNAFAIINPKLKDCKYPDKNLCGAGVVFKLVQALIKKQKENFLDLNLEEISEGWEKWLLDMVGIATISDMVPLVGENRIFAKYGLLVLKKTKRNGLKKLLKKCKIEADKINEEDIGFSISPRINAASRMGEPEIAFKMLFTDSEIEAEEIVNHLDKINNERKGKVASMVKDIKKYIQENSNEKINESPIIVHGHTDWQPSLLGLAASSIVEKFNKPVFLWGKGEGENFKGSCRSNGAVNLVGMMQNVRPEKIYEFGGHEMAGGFSVYDNSVFDLHEELEKAYHLTKDVNKGDIVKEIIIDHQININDVDWNLFNEIEKLAPFGTGNPKPVFKIYQAPVFDISFFGKEKNHLKIVLLNDKSKKIEAISFFNDDYSILEKVKNGSKIDLIVNLEKSNFGYYPSLRLRILHIM